MDKVVCAVKLLLLGGTAFVGRAIATMARQEGIDVTCVARGNSGDFPEGVAVLRADRDDPTWAEQLGDARFDAAIDLSRQPGQVRRDTRSLLRHVGHYVFISSINVYADMATRGLDESAALVAPLEADVLTDMADYGAAKVACAQAVVGAFGPRRTTLIRPGLIGGHGDASGRSGYWPWRFAQAADSGHVLVPDALDAPAQIIDVRCLAAFALTCALGQTAGIFNATGPRSTLGELLAAAAQAAGSTATLVPAGAQELAAHGVRGWSGAQSLPLWIAEPHTDGFLDHDNTAALQAGLILRPAQDTFAKALAFEQERGAAPWDAASRGAGLDDVLEGQILASLGASA